MDGNKTPEICTSAELNVEKETILSLVKQLNDGLTTNSITPEQEEKLREDISDLQMNYLIGTLFED